MARFLAFKNVILLSCSIATLSLFSDSVFGSEEKEDLSGITHGTVSPDSDPHGDPIFISHMLDWHRNFALRVTNLEREKVTYDANINELKERVSFLETALAQSNISALTERLDSFITLQSAPSSVSAMENQQPEIIERPLIAQGNEALYERFMAGSLIYKPTEGSTVGQIFIPIRDIANPTTLEGTFNLSGCGDSGQHLSISTGFRRGKIVENAGKVEVWIVPKFMAEQNVEGSASHLMPALASWSAPYGIFFTSGNWNELDKFDYEIYKEPEELRFLNMRIIQSSNRPYRPVESIHFNEFTCGALSNLEKFTLYF